MSDNDKKPTPKELKRLVRQAVKSLDESCERPPQRIEEKPIEPKIVGKCGVCNGDVIENIITRQTGPVILGPGNRTSTGVGGYYCKDCGLQYKFPPKKGGGK